MVNFDLTPLFRSSIGFDRLTELLESAARLDDAEAGYPPYNIEKRGDDDYRITMAVAGFGLEDLNIETNEGTLWVSGMPMTTATFTCTAGLPAAPSGAASSWPTSCAWLAPVWKTACCTSTWCARCQRR